jgi:hypothetical protein
MPLPVSQAAPGFGTSMPQAGGIQAMTEISALDSPTLAHTVRDGLRLPVARDELPRGPPQPRAGR